MSIATLLALLGQNTQVGGYGTPGIGDGIPGNPPMAQAVPPMAAAGYDRTGLETAPDGTDVLPVTARQAPPPEYLPPRYQLNPELDNQTVTLNQQAPDTSLLPRTEASPQELSRQKNYTNLPQHKGAFGMKGTLRDVLGLLGDSLLIGAGRQPIYRPQRDQEKASDALVGYGMGDDAADQNAIARLAEVNPALAIKLAQDRYDRRLTSQKLDVYTEAQSRKALSSYKDGVRLFSQAANALSQDPRQAQYLLPIMAKIKNDFGLGDEYQLPQPDQATGLYSAYGMAGTPAYQQQQIPLRERQLDISQQNADANTTRANRPPQGRQPRAQTPLEYFQQIDSKPENKRTKGEKAFYEKYTKSGRGSSRLRSTTETPSSGLRVISVRPAQ